ncbi:unnamed protein product [Rotaria sordida]|uniref:Uncharacterized protein n=1 Tax=Rotaria sordida TaxID=392033 RepID=A0A819LY15_9BILA|nr:unnamed protein product [Rotaria sordida]CAF1301449.1 unnamed protein product [Rotaria sordida]CAF3970448.1 unnamed protein product [Rotaria sordida]
MGLYKNERFCYLNHTAKLFEKDPFYTLGFILDRLQEELEKCFDEFSNDFIFKPNDLHLIVGGGQAKEYDILRQDCSLLATKDTEVLDKLNKYFDNTSQHYLYRKLMNNVTILNAVSFPMDEHEEVEAMDENFYEI